MTATLNNPSCGTQPGTQPGTQLGTQLGTSGGRPPHEHDEEMAHADTALILRVLESNGLDQSWLALECNLSKSYVSRVLSGQHPVPHDMVRRLFSRTSDPSLLDLFSGSEGRTRLHAVSRDAVPCGVGIDDVLPSVMLNLAESAQQARGGQPSAASGGIHRAICALLGALDTAREQSDRNPEPGRDACAHRPNIVPLGPLDRLRAAVVAQGDRVSSIDRQA